MTFPLDSQFPRWNPTTARLVQLNSSDLQSSGSLSNSSSGGGGSSSSVTVVQRFVDASDSSESCCCTDSASFQVETSTTRPSSHGNSMQRYTPLVVPPICHEKDVLNNNENDISHGSRDISVAAPRGKTRVPVLGFHGNYADPRRDNGVIPESHVYSAYSRVCRLSAPQTRGGSAASHYSTNVTIGYHSTNTVVSHGNANTLTHTSHVATSSDHGNRAWGIHGNFAASHSGSSSDCIVACHVPVCDLSTSTSTCDIPREQDSKPLASGVNAARASAAKPAETTKGDQYLGAEFQKNWPTSTGASDSSSHFELSAVQQPRFQPSYRPVAVKFTTAPDRPADGPCNRNALGDHTVGEQKSAFVVNQRFPAWHSQSSGAADVFDNVSNNPASSGQVRQSPEQSQQPPQQQQSKQKPAQYEKDHRESCMASCSVLHILGLAMYYLLLWSVTAGLTYLLLELTLLVTSRGSLPYYSGPHSYFLVGGRIGYLGCNPELGKVTEFRNFTALVTTLKKELSKKFEPEDAKAKWRQCEKPEEDKPETTDPEELNKPCNLTNLKNEMLKMLNNLQNQTPAVIIEMKRQLGYLPASGDAVSIKCRAEVDGSGKSLPVSYYSWTGSNLTHSHDSGTVPTFYYPMLSRLHRVPSVLLVVRSKDNSSLVGQQLAIRCRSSDGSEDAEKPERELLLKVNS